MTRSRWFAVAAVPAVMWLAWRAAADRPTDAAPYVRVACQTWVKEQLKAPASAHFSGVTASRSDSGLWTVTGSVDSQNSFGAELRSSWHCLARHVGEVTSRVEVEVG